MRGTVKNEGMDNHALNFKVFMRCMRGKGMPEHFSVFALILIALVGEIVLYPVLMQYSGVGYCALAVENAEASSSTDGVDVAVSFQNAGSKTITSASLEVEGNVLAEVNEQIPPGKGGSFVAQNPPGVWVCGSRKTGAIKVTYADGSSASFLVAIPVTGGAFNSGGQQPGSQQSGGQQSGGPSQKRVLISDTFDDGLSDWTLWGYTQAFAIETDAHGKPAPALHVYGNGPVGVKAGAAKTVSLPPGTTTISLVLTFDFNVQALPNEKVFPGNLWFRVDAGGSTLFDEQIYKADSVDSGWKSAEVQINLPQPAPDSLTLIIYMVDQSSKVQEFWLDNVVLDA
jgi:hypothetical protein